MDEAKVEALAERVLSGVNGAMSVLNIYIGHRLGLFRMLSDTGPATSAELAQTTGFAERYLREWLSALATGEYICYDPATGTFSVSAEQAAVFLEEDHPAYSSPFTQWIPSMTSVMPELLEAFRTGDGIPYESYGQDCLDAIGLGNRPMFVNDYASKWIPALPDVEARLKAGGKVADVGCGIGWSAISLAKGFPAVQIDAIDIDANSIAQARENAEQEGVSSQITFHRAPIEDVTLTGPYDLVTAFECLHDIPYPVEALKKMRELAGPNGAVLIADEAAADTIEENTNFMGNFFYNFSVLHCLPATLALPGSAGTGTAIGPSTVRKFAEEAGFKSVDILDIENPMFRFYRLTP